MGPMATAWHPAWWNDQTHGAAWELVRESVHRDWEQTKYDLGLGGQELHQGIGDTLKQACGAAPLPAGANPIAANPPLSLGEWHELEGPYGYGFGARREFGGQHPQWNPVLEGLLRNEWTAAHDRATRDWRDVVRFVRRGYEFHDRPAPGSATGSAEEPRTQ